MIINCFTPKVLSCLILSIHFIAVANTECCDCISGDHTLTCSEDTICQSNVCENDHYCCDTEWDDVCDRSASNICKDQSDDTESPTPEPTASPTTSPTPEPTPKPTKSPTPSPTSQPTPTPTSSLTTPPTSKPTTPPISKPTTPPTSKPTTPPTPRPTPVPTAPPTIDPTPNPTSGPTISPTVLTLSPTTNPPTRNPITSEPTPEPTPRPTAMPTEEGSLQISSLSHPATTKSSDVTATRINTTRNLIHDQIPTRTTTTYPITTTVAGLKITVNDKNKKQNMNKDNNEDKTEQFLAMLIVGILCLFIMLALTIVIWCFYRKLCKLHTYDFVDNTGEIDDIDINEIGQTELMDLNEGDHETLRLNVTH